MKKQLYHRIFLFVILFSGLIALAQYSFVLSHTLVEIIGVVVAWSVFLFVWNARPYLENKFLLLIGISYLLVGFFQLFHALSYKEMNLFPGYNGVLSMQFWTAARILEGGALLTAFLLVKKEIKVKTFSAACLCCSATLLSLVFSHSFPDIFIRFRGLSEFLTNALFLSAVLVLHKLKTHLGKRLVLLLTWSCLLNIVSGFLIVSLLSSNHVANLFAHFLRLLSWYLLYRAIITTGFVDPYNMLFGNLNRMRDAESDARKRAEARATELDALRANLTDMLAEHETCRLLHAILTRSVSLLKATGGELGLFDHKKHDIVIVAGHNRSNRKGQRLRLGQGIMGAVAQTREPVIMHSESSPEILKDSWHCLMAAPLIAGGNLVGVLMIVQTNVLHEFTPADLNLFTMFAQQAAMAIRNTQLLEDARRRAETDSLTGLYNHRHFFDLAGHEIKRALRYKHHLTAIMFDIDHFKKVNDTFGHGVGDQVLVSISNLCRQLFRSIDIIGRYGGEEFAVLLPETSLSTARDVAERLRRAVSATVITHHGQHISVTISLGIAALRSDSNTISRLMERADTALYHAKREGRNQISIWDPSMQKDFLPGAGKLNDNLPCTFRKGNILRYKKRRGVQRLNVE